MQLSTSVGLNYRPHERLHQRREFLEVYRFGYKVHSGTFVVYIRENNYCCHRLGLTVSRKIGNASVRNRIKRRLRALFRLQKREIAGSLDIVINVKRSAALATYQELGRDLDRSLARAIRGIAQWQLD